MDANEAEYGAGPYTVTKGTGSWAVTRDGKTVKGPYGALKTAARACRALNGATEPEAPTFLEDAPIPYKPSVRTLIKREKAKPKGKAKVEKPAKPAPAPVPAVEALGELKPYQGTREEWLKAFTDKARVEFKQRGLVIPDKVRVSIGFMFRSPKAIGQCWHESASADGHREVFINPTEADSARVADILTHELAHTLFGPDEKHGKNFKAAVTKLGLEGKATATVAGDGWRAWAFPILRELGAIPHAALDPMQSGVKKQSTRLLKCECDTCGFIFRATAKHVNGKALHCPDFECVGAVRVDGQDEGDEE
jgi:hypothetical protein